MNIDPTEVKNILIVRQHNQLGDMLCSVPLFAALRKKFKDASITLVASPMNYKILFNEINPYIDDVIVYDKSTAKHILRFIKKLRSKKYDIGIVPSTFSISRTSHYINFISGAKIRAGVNSIDGKNKKVGYLLNVKKDVNWEEKKMHQTERNLDVGRLIGCDLTAEEKKNISIKLSKEEKEFAEKYAAENFPDKNREIIAFHAGAGKVANRWDKDNFVNLIKKLYEKYDCYIVLTSGPIDNEITDYIKAKLEEKSIFVNIPSGMTTREEGAIIAKTSLYITNDTGMMHVAAYMNSNVIGLFGPTNGYEWAPINDKGSYIQSPTGDINEITVESIFEEAIKQLDKNNV
ncbi:lipopolysaccharide heptosyltransferase family protein [bacterium]|nr:MAG: lipopolysaccharide heptosyltransferase family protein [bacterium]